MKILKKKLLIGTCGLEMRRILNPSIVILFQVCSLFIISLIILENDTSFVVFAFRMVQVLSAIQRCPLWQYEFLIKFFPLLLLQVVEKQLSSMP
jgi:hypothetical protein